MQSRIKSIIAKHSAVASPEIWGWAKCLILGE